MSFSHVTFVCVCVSIYIQGFLLPGAIHDLFRICDLMWFTPEVRCQNSPQGFLCRNINQGGMICFYYLFNVKFTGREHALLLIVFIHVFFLIYFPHFLYIHIRYPDIELLFCWQKYSGNKTWSLESKKND